MSMFETETVRQSAPWRPALYGAPADTHAASIIDSLASWSESAAPGPLDIMGGLLASCALSEDRDCPALRPLWADEAMHRAYSFVRLLQTGAESGTALAPRSRWTKYSAASRLSRTLLSLQVSEGDNDRACDQTLRQIAQDMTALFGARLPHVQLSLAIERLSLSLYRHRALMLLGTELLINAFTHAFVGQTNGFLQVGLRMLSPELAQLYVADDGVGLNQELPYSPISVASGLASLLQGQCRYRCFGIWSTFADVTFPIRVL